MSCFSGVCNESHFLWALLLNLFLTAFSVLPGRSLAISDHLFPKTSCASKTTLSSTWLHSPFLIVGSRWLNQRCEVSEATS